MDNFYGWIDKSGFFTQSNYGCHLECAQNIIESHNWDDEYIDWINENQKSRNGFGSDFLVYKKGWVLMENPSYGIPIPTFDIRSVNRSQVETVLELYNKLIKENPEYDMDAEREIDQFKFAVNY